MSLAFLNPLLLFGLAAAILPILIHRLTKRKAITRKFSAVHLLLQSEKVVARPQRLKHLFLLILRVLSVVSLALMMAQPVLISPGLLASESGAAKVVILDNSLSMNYHEEQGERFGLAKKAAKELIKGLKGLVVIIPMAQIPGPRMEEKEIPWISPEEAFKKLDAIPLSFGRGDPAAAFSLAYQKLKDFKGGKEVLVISDMTRGDWEGFHLSNLAAVPGDVGTVFLRIGSANRDSNFAVQGVRLVEGEAVVGVPARLEVTVSNLSEKPGSPLLKLYLSGAKMDQKTIQLKAFEEGKAYFDLFSDRPGWVNGEARLSGDRLPSDDVFYFTLNFREKVRVLIVDGDPRTSLKASESYYLVNALHPGGLEGSPFIAKVVTAGELAGLDLKPYDAAFLLNMERPNTSVLASFLETGKPVFLFLGDRAMPEEYNRIPLLPWRIKEAKEAWPSKPERIAEVDSSRASLRSLSGPGWDNLKSASFRRYFKIEGSTGDLLTLESRDPLLVQADLGRGKIFLFASSADLDWNDLALKAAYLPLIQGLLKETMALNKDSLPASLRFGEPFEDKTPPTQVLGFPGGPGIYQFLLPTGELRRAVNPPIKESDLGKVDMGELKKKFGTIDVQMVEYKEGDLVSLQGSKKELWPFLLAFLLVVLALEMGVANRI